MKRKPRRRPVPVPARRLRPPEWKRFFLIFGAAMLAGGVLVLGLTWADRAGVGKIKDVRIVSCDHDPGSTEIGYEISNDTRFSHVYRIEFEAHDGRMRRLGKITVVERLGPGGFVRGEARMTTAGTAEECVIRDVS